MGDVNGPKRLFPNYGVDSPSRTVGALLPSPSAYCKTLSLSTLLRAVRATLLDDVPSDESALDCHAERVTAHRWCDLSQHADGSERSRHDGIYETATETCTMDMYGLTLCDVRQHIELNKETYLNVWVKRRIKSCTPLT